VSADAREIVYGVLLKHGPGDFLTCRCGWGPVQRSVIDLANHRAGAVIAALTGADLLLPDGGEVREVWDVETAGVRWPGYETESAAWAQVAKVKAWTDKPTVRVLRRTITDWSDGRRHVAPGTEVQP